MGNATGFEPEPTTTLLAKSEPLLAEVERLTAPSVPRVFVLFLIVQP
jgi:hypothetical protein